MKRTTQKATTSTTQFDSFDRYMHRLRAGTFTRQDADDFDRHMSRLRKKLRRLTDDQLKDEAKAIYARAGSFVDGNALGAVSFEIHRRETTKRVRR